MGSRKHKLNNKILIGSPEEYVHGRTLSIMLTRITGVYYAGVGQGENMSLKFGNAGIRYILIFQKSRSDRGGSGIHFES